MYNMKNGRYVSFCSDCGNEVFQTSICPVCSNLKAAARIAEAQEKANKIAEEAARSAQVSARILERQQEQEFYKWYDNVGRPLLMSNARDHLPSKSKAGRFKSAITFSAHSLIEYQAQDPLYGKIDLIKVGAEYIPVDIESDQPILNAVENTIFQRWVNRTIIDESVFELTPQKIKAAVLDKEKVTKKIITDVVEQLIKKHVSGQKSSVIIYELKISFFYDYEKAKIENMHLRSKIVEADIQFYIEGDKLKVDFPKFFEITSPFSRLYMEEFIKLANNVVTESGQVVNGVVVTKKELEKNEKERKSKVASHLVFWLIILPFVSYFTLGGIMNFVK
jgi:hypothetical protein